MPTRPIVWLLASTIPISCCSTSNATTSDGGPALSDGATDAAISDSSAPTGCGSATPAAPVDEQRSVTVASAQRSYWIHVPASYQGAASPLVIDFHGDTPRSYGDPALLERSFDGIVAKADAEGFLVVNPIGLRDSTGNATWNAGSCCSTDKSTDDVGFVQAIVDAVEGAFCVDVDRVFVTGYSSGAFMAYRLACEASDRVAAVAPVAGQTGVTCTPSRAVSVIDFAGTTDPFVDYAGVTGTTIPGWVARDGCAGASTRTFANGDSTCDTWGGCTGGAEVTLCTVDGGGHTWPGGSISEDAGVGHTTHDLVAMDALWEFFKKHPMH